MGALLAQDRRGREGKKAVSPLGRRVGPLRLQQKRPNPCPGCLAEIGEAGAIPAEQSVGELRGERWAAFHAPKGPVGNDAVCGDLEIAGRIADQLAKELRLILLELI